jgi:hypothetical protein
MLALFMVLIPRYLLTVLRLLTLILMSQRKIGTSIMRHIPAKTTEVCTVDRILPEPYFEKTPFPAKVKEHFDTSQTYL